MGIVYEALDMKLHRLIAIKEVRLANQAPYKEIQALNIFKHEANILLQLAHTHIPRMYDHFYEAGGFYLVMELIIGKTLEEYIQAAQGKMFSLKYILALGIQLSSLLNYLHTLSCPIVFHDLKPANVMMTLSGKLYLIDFGVARYFQPESSKNTISFGTIGYAAPEQYGRAQTTPRSDIYSLGAILHRLLTGEDPSKRPFYFRPLHAQSSRIPPALAHLVMSMTDLDEKKRPVNAAIIMRDLQSIYSFWEGTYDLKHQVNHCI